PFNPHCENCFNPETWDFSGGKEWTQEIRDKFITLANRSYIKRISILGGEPLAEENLDDVLYLVNEIRLLSPKKTIWIYSGYQWEHIYTPQLRYHSQTQEKLSIEKRKQIISQCDVLIDGRYIESQRDIALKWRGSKNQRVIDIKKSLQKGEIILWES
ncbi:MAG: radical SAM protein, partial [Eubacterium sp.]|nr:radical SAM protein [Eubacterium sp.]